MLYIDEEGREFALPKLTVSLSEEISEACDASLPVRERVAKQLAVCRKCLPADYVAEACDGKTADTVDVSLLAALFRSVKAAYDAPEAERALDSMKFQLETVAPLLEAYSALQGMSKPMSRQGFSRVR